MDVVKRPSQPGLWGFWRRAAVALAGGSPPSSALLCLTRLHPGRVGSSIAASSQAPTLPTPHALLSKAPGEVGFACVAFWASWELASYPSAPAQFLFGARVVACPHQVWWDLNSSVRPTGLWCSSCKPCGLLEPLSMSLAWGEWAAGPATGPELSISCSVILLHTLLWSIKPA